MMMTNNMKKKSQKKSMVGSVTTIRKLQWQQQKDEKNIKRQRQ
jgi:hypothetical protein